jgi:hypothetical protein
MSKPLWLLAAALCLMPPASHAANLTDVEARWLRAAAPVLAYAEHDKLPIDVVVQPQPAPGRAPLATAFVDGRCKLVLSMRGNPQAEAPLAEAAPSLAPALIEAMTAHELGHCWRHLQGVWHALPAGFSEEASQPDADKELAQLQREMRETRREEGFADLVGLAWTQTQHPAQYAQVHAWLAKVRAAEPEAGSHDTRAWLRLAEEPTGFGTGSPFERVRALWEQGLLSDD